MQALEPAVKLNVVLLIILFAVIAGCGPQPVAEGDTQAASTSKPLIIAHRGASGIYPEHTLQAYEAAIDMGADYIEVDLVMTRDGFLVARHDRHLSGSTNVADRPEFADRRTIKDIGGSPREDWFVEDFTLGELKSLRARQTFTGRDARYDDEFSIPTFIEVLGLVAVSNSPEHTIGIYPELKSPAYFASIGLDMETALLEQLEGFNGPVFIQSFEPDSLRRINAQADWPLVQLLPVTTDESLTPEMIAEYADGVGPWKDIVMRFRGGPQAFMDMAHGAGLIVHPYTYRADDLAPGNETFADELTTAFQIGVDGVFTDHPGQALDIRDRVQPARE